MKWENFNHGRLGKTQKGQNDGMEIGSADEMEGLCFILEVMIFVRFQVL